MVICPRPFWYVNTPPASTNHEPSVSPFTPLVLGSFFLLPKKVHFCSICEVSGWEALLIKMFSSVQLLSHVQLFAAPWTAACQAFLSITNSQSLLKLMSIKSVLPFNPPFSCLQSFPASGSFPISQFFESGGQSIGVSVSTSVIPMNIQDWFPLGWTGWISLQPKGLSRVFSNTTIWKHQFFGTQLSLWSNSLWRSRERHMQHHD